MFTFISAFYTKFRYWFSFISYISNRIFMFNSKYYLCIEIYRYKFILTQPPNTMSSSFASITSPLLIVFIAACDQWSSTFFLWIKSLFDNGMRHVLELTSFISTHTNTHLLFVGRCARATYCPKGEISTLWINNFRRGYVYQRRTWDRNA